MQEERQRHANYRGLLVKLSDKDARFEVIQPAQERRCPWTSIAHADDEAAGK
jgi:hypothetical protein